MKLAPVIFQEIIEARSDIRATVIDETVFVVSIDPQHPGARYDWRLDRFAKVKPHALPQQMERALILLLRSSGLRYGAIDMRLTPKGEYVFLEVNTAGEFLFCEIEAGHRISRAMASALLRTP